MHCDFEESRALAIDKHERKELVDMKKIPGSAGTIEQKAINR